MRLRAGPITAQPASGLEETLRRLGKARGRLRGAPRGGGEGETWAASTRPSAKSIPLKAQARLSPTPSRGSTAHACNAFLPAVLQRPGRRWTTLRRQARSETRSSKCLRRPPDAQASTSDARAYYQEQNWRYSPRSRAPTTSWLCPRSQTLQGRWTTPHSHCCHRPVRRTVGTKTPDADPAPPAFSSPPFGRNAT